jgi:hypothetical protein
MELNLKTVESFLDDLFTHDEGYRDEHLLRALSLFEEPGDVVSLIRSIHSSPTLLQSVARNSYSHVNGFEKLVLLASPRLGYKLRLHIWWPDERRETREDIHNHRWDFGSRILLGQLEFENFIQASEGSRLLRYASYSRGSEECFRFQQTGSAQLSSGFTGRLKMGSFYCQPHHAAHASASERSVTTATLLVQGPPRRDFSDVFLPRARENQTKIAAFSLRPEQVARQLEEIAARLQRSQVPYQPLRAAV